jgi:RNA polymerase sigma-70 factor (ECF subfamily)
MSSVSVSEATVHLGAEELFVQHARFVASFLARLGVEEIDDAVQDVFLVAHRKGGFADAGARPTTWLAEIAVRVASTRRRTARRRKAVLDPEAGKTSATTPTPEDQADARRSLERVQQALDALDLEDRALFVLFELEAEPCDAIARSLGVPVGTVYSRLFTARQAFQKAYARVTRPQAQPVPRSGP